MPRGASLEGASDGHYHAYAHASEVVMMTVFFFLMASGSGEVILQIENPDYIVSVKGEERSAAYAMVEVASPLST